MARFRIPGISLCNKLKRFVAIAQLALWNIDEVVVVDVVFFSLVSHEDSHQLVVNVPLLIIGKVEPTALMMAVVSLVLEPAVVNFDLLTFRQYVYPNAYLNVCHYTAADAASPSQNFYTALLLKAKTHEVDVISLY